MENKKLPVGIENFEKIHTGKIFTISIKRA